MTLSEIETILEELTVRHPNLTSELLTTMLTASGWESKDIQDAVILFKRDAGTKKSSSTKPESSPLLQVSPVEQKLTPLSSSVVNDVSLSQPVSSAPLSEEKMTFLLPDGTEEGDLVVPPSSGEVVRQEEKNEKEAVAPSVSQQETEEKHDNEAREPGVISIDEEHQKDIDHVQVMSQNQEEIMVTQTHLSSEEKSDNSSLLPQATVPTPSSIPTISLKDLPPLTTREEKDLRVINDNKPKTSTKPNLIPEDLPLVPFESSPHVWSFARYKDVFHKDIVPEEEAQSIAHTSAHTSPEIDTKEHESIPSAPSVSSEEKHEEGEVEEILVEKTPMTKGDESLVFLAGLMLLAIILILGYMYSNGRL